MEAVVKFSAEELRKAREELHRELDKGIRDMEMGRVMPCDEAIRSVCEELGLPYV